jgi:hypothetical protein
MTPNKVGVGQDDMTSRRNQESMEKNISPGKSEKEALAIARAIAGKLAKFDPMKHHGEIDFAAPIGRERFWEDYGGGSAKSSD